MATHHERVPVPQPPTRPRPGERQLSKAVLQRQMTLMASHIAVLERELAAEREKRQAVVDRYERLLSER